MVQNNIDILAIAETKLDSSFPSAQFLVYGYKTPYRKDGNKYGGGLLVYVKEDIPCCQLTNHPPVPRRTRKAPHDENSAILG